VRIAYHDPRACYYSKNLRVPVWTVGSARMPPVLRRYARSRMARVFTRFAAGSAVATVCSQLTLLLLFGVGDVSAMVAGAAAFLAGAVPNFVIHRFWTWRRSGRVQIRRELVPYLAVIAFNGLVAVGVTTGMDRLVASSITSHALHTVALAVSFAASYLLLFVLKFALLDRLVFRSEDPATADPAPASRTERSRHQVPTITRV
jgi:putative flippase GtrA